MWRDLRFYLKQNKSQSNLCVDIIETELYECALTKFNLTFRSPCSSYSIWNYIDKIVKLQTLCISWLFWLGVSSTKSQFNRTWSTLSMRLSFLMSNSSPGIEIVDPGINAVDALFLLWFAIYIQKLFSEWYLSSLFLLIKITFSISFKYHR